MKRLGRHKKLYSEALYITKFISIAHSYGITNAFGNLQALSISKALFFFSSLFTEGHVCMKWKI